MQENVIQVGVDVDDQAFHFSCVLPSGEILAKGVRSLPSTKALLNKIRSFTKQAKFVVAYEAGYLGYTLARELDGFGIECKVIAPTSIKRCPNERVKNDRIDSLRLAQGLWRKEFSFVSIPTKEQESDRQMIRARSFLVSQKSDLKRHILNQCRLLGLDYKKETGAKDYWTKLHRDWIDKKIRDIPESMHIALTCLIASYENLLLQIESLETQIDSLAERRDYKEKCNILSCFKGFSNITSMTLITEIFDIRRFEHPKKLVAFCGLDIREYSSGGKQQQYGISKMGNRRLRTALVEACQSFAKSKTPSKRKQAARRCAHAGAIALADKCQARIYKKGHRLLAKDKNRNKVKVACAREMVGFIWEAMNMAA